MSRSNITRIPEPRPLARHVSDCIPGWPLEWVSAKGCYTGNANTLVLIHVAAVQIYDAQKYLLLTAKDRKRRSWSTSVILDAGPLADAVETELARRLHVQIGQVGAAALRANAAGRKSQDAAGAAEDDPALAKEPMVVAVAT